MNKSDHKRQIEKAHPFRSRNTEDAILSSLKETDNFKSLNFISTLGYALKSRTGFEDILKTIMTKLDTQLKAESQTIHLVDRANDIFESYFFADKDIFKIEKIPLTDKSMIAGIALEKRKTIIIPSENHKYTTKGDLLSAQSEKPKSALCVPMISRGESLGVIELINKTDGTIFNETALPFLVSIIDFITLIIENQILLKKNIELSTIDDVSNLYNLKHFKQMLNVELKRANRNSKPFSLIFFYLYFFKDINDTHGHQTGSSVLNKIGKLLKDNLRETDISARYGGDEFVVILPQTDEKNAKIVAEKLRKLISKTTFSKEDRVTLKITASFGIATYPIHSTNPETLLKLADQAMYMVKKSGRNGVRVYS